MENIIASFNFTSILWQIAIPLFFSAGDIISGFIQAVINNDVDSKVMRTGLLHKILLILIIILSFVIHVGLRVAMAFKSCMCLYNYNGNNFYIRKLKKGGNKYR